MAAVFPDRGCVRSNRDHPCRLQFPPAPRRFSCHRLRLREFARLVPRFHILSLFCGNLKVWLQHAQADLHARLVLHPCRCRDFARSYRAVCPCARRKPRSVLRSCETKSESMTCSTTKKPRRSSATENTNGFTKSESILKRSSAILFRRIHLPSASV